MSQYIVEFRNGDKILEKKKFKSIDGRDGVRLYIYMKSLGKNLDKSFNFYVKQKGSDWYQQYDNNGTTVSICGKRPSELIANEVLSSYSERLINLLKEISDEKK